MKGGIETETERERGMEGEAVRYYTLQLGRESKREGGKGEVTRESRVRGDRVTDQEKICY